MTILDISWPLSEQTTAYKNKKTLQFQATKQFAHDGVRETLITLSSHTGTHIDAPSHFIESGATTTDISLSALCGPCHVIDMTHVTDCIRAHHIEKSSLPQKSRILFKTRNSSHAPTDPFDTEFIYLHADAAALLVKYQTIAIGIDYLGIERNQPGHETHTTLLKNKIALIEGLRLNHITAGPYQLFCLPLALQGLDGAPARVILIKS